MTQVWGPVIYSQAISGSEHQRILRRVQRGELIRLSRGVYVDRRVYRGLAGQEQNRMRIVTTAKARGMPVVGCAAAFLHALPFEFRMETISVELGRRKGADTRNSLCIRSVRPDCAGHFIEGTSPWGRFQLSSAVRTTLDIARWHPLPEAVGMMEDGINRGLLSKDTLCREAEKMRGVSRIGSIKHAVMLSTPWSESPRESHLKACLFDAGLPAPLQQVEIYNDERESIARVDFFYEDICMAIEYDGQGKRHGQYGWSPELVLRHEIQRHESLSREGILVFRVDSTNYRDGSAVRKIKEIYDRASRLPRPFLPSRYSAKGRAW